MKKYRFSVLSIILSIVCIITVIVVNRKIVGQYLLSDGKTRALFGITEILEFSYQYYLIIPNLISLFLGLIAIRKKEKKLTIQIALSISILSIILIFSRIWRLMI